VRTAVLVDLLVARDVGALRHRSALHLLSRHRRGVDDALAQLVDEGLVDAFGLSGNDFGLTDVGLRAALEIVN
jgi:hypothetical protein